MLINFKKENAGILNIPESMTKEERAAYDKLPAERKAHLNPKVVSLTPGMNDILDKSWNKIKENERIVTYRSRGWIVLPYAEEIPSKKEGVAAKELTVTKYEDLKAAEQEALIIECEQIALLKKWKSKTKESVLPFLIDKLDKLQFPEKYAKDEE